MKIAELKALAKTATENAVARGTKPVHKAAIAANKAVVEAIDAEGRHPYKANAVARFYWDMAEAHKTAARGWSLAREVTYQSTCSFKHPRDWEFYMFSPKRLVLQLTGRSLPIVTFCTGGPALVRVGLCDVSAVASKLTQLSVREVRKPKVYRSAPAYYD